jgi:hypothetical protein
MRDALRNIRARTWWALAALTLVLAAAIYSSTDHGSATLGYVWTRLRGGYTVADRLAMHGEDVRLRVAPRFANAGVGYPPPRVALLAFKDARKLEVYARRSDAGAWKKITSYPILGMSGRQGPKLREGDRQVPEGIYRAEFLNANSMFHLSIRLDYPNAYDRARGAADGRDALGSDIMIHGSTSSIGCLAMGNEAAEDLFVLAALAGKENVDIVIAPSDFRRAPPLPDGGPPWLSDLYGKIDIALRDFAAEK